ncbi:molecular chaperone DnaJ [Nonomuraea sp. WAC 01424]|uniref:molecular chaperone DnaJ n=1 Tax=Nonomuraea sp. WAC 01424 TaxID=2203200 RepID=UPI000F77B304|nr:molecular chaperone DnaJ [Nonomuraea sp. WAC 01424]RSM98777.1 molecular chaperone DnaJ [Nonomuraea sp. WAC 01424]
MNPARAAAIVDGARSAQELFAGDSPARVYRRLARALHPDLAPGGEEAFKRLVTLWETYRRGQRVGDFLVGPPLHKGGTAVLYPAGRGAERDSLLKVARDPAGGRLLVREAAALRRIAAEGDPRFLPYVPRLVASFRYRGGGVVRQANVISRAPAGFVTLEHVGTGLDPRDVAWIWRRLLVAAGLAHRAGVAHGAVLPRHVLVHPLDHGLVLVDWCHGDRLDERADIAGLTGCVDHLMGACPRRMRAFVRGCLLRPPSDAWELLRELDELLDDLYGPRTYRPLHL